MPMYTLFTWLRLAWIGLAQQYLIDIAYINLL